MIIESQEDLKGLEACAAVTKETLNTLKSAAKVGTSTKELELLAKNIFAKHGARSAPTLVYDFPGTVLLSLNDEAVHGIPNDRLIEAGDILKIDVTPELNGYITDACITVAIEPVTKVSKLLLKTSQKALEKAMAATRVGVRVNELGRVIEKEVKRNGFSVIRELGGHGVGKSIHEQPEIMNFYDPKNTARLEEGMVITIEPIIAVGAGNIYKAEDNWTIKTTDQSNVAHFEHTLIVKKSKPIILTA